MRRRWQWIIGIATWLMVAAGVFVLSRPFSDLPPLLPVRILSVEALPDLLAGCEARVSRACLAHLFHACPERAALRCQQWRAAAVARGR